MGMVPPKSDYREEGEQKDEVLREIERTGWAPLLLSFKRTATSIRLTGGERFCESKSGPTTKNRQPPLMSRVVRA